MYTGDDFNYAELIAGDEDGYSDALLGIFDAIAPAASGGAGAARGGRRARLPRHPGADRAAVAPHLQGADPLLQDRRRVPGLSQRPAGSFRDDRRPAERALAASIWPSCSASPTRRGCCAIPSSPRARMRQCCSAVHGRRRERRRMTVEGLSINLATVAAAMGPWRQAVEALPARTASPRSRRGATSRRRSGWTRRPRIVRDNGLRVTGLCRGGMFPARDRGRRGGARSTTTAAPIDEAAALGADCLVLVVGGLPEGSRDIAGAARDGRATASPRSCRTPARAECRSPSSRCIRCMRPTAPA